MVNFCNKLKVRIHIMVLLEKTLGKSPDNPIERRPFLPSPLLAACLQAGGRAGVGSCSATLESRHVRRVRAQPGFDPALFTPAQVTGYLELAACSISLSLMDTIWHQCTEFTRGSSGGHHCV
jgi:hypothetical protein